MKPVAKTISWKIHTTPAVIYKIRIPMWQPALVILSIVTVCFAYAELFFPDNTTGDLSVFWLIIGFVWLWLSSPFLIYLNSRRAYRTDLCEYKIINDELMVKVDAITLRYRLNELEVERNEDQVLILRLNDARRRAQRVALYFEDLNIKAEVLSRVKEANGN